MVRRKYADCKSSGRGIAPRRLHQCQPHKKGDFTMKLSDWITIIGAIATIVITVAESSQENKINNL